MAEELCRADYVGLQIAGQVVIAAIGTHPTAGYEVRLRDTPIAVFPPEFNLVHTAPSGPSAQVETGFLVFTSFPSSDPVKMVRVHDAEGPHEVGVVQTEVGRLSDLTFDWRLPGKAAAQQD